MDAITKSRRKALVDLLVHYVDRSRLAAYLAAQGWRESPHRCGQQWTAPLQADEAEPIQILLWDWMGTRHLTNVLTLISLFSALQPEGEESAALGLVLDLLPPAIRTWVEQGMDLLEVSDARA